MDWIQSCVDRYSNAAATDVHDQATYTTAWEPVLSLRPDSGVVEFLKTTRDRIHRHYVDTDQWRHGYWRMQEAHHGTEHFELFLAMLYRLDPEDEVTRKAFLDMAEHLGNWSADVSPWFEESSHTYTSTWFGSDGVRRLPGSEINVPDHFRCANLSLIAYDMTGEDRYLDLAAKQIKRWADPMANEGWIPVAVLPEAALKTLNAEQSEAYREFAGQSPKHLDHPVCQAENLLASDGPRTLLRLWQQTGDITFRRAAELLLDHLVTQLQDPDAGAAAEAVRVYRAFTGGESRYDSLVLEAVKESADTDVHSLSLHPECRRELGGEIGVGKRSDRPVWMEEGHPRSVNPITLSLAAELKEDPAWAIRSLDRGRAYLQLARQAFPDGRDHGCSSRSVSAVARGHGRDNHAGILTAVLAPLAAVFA